MEFNRTDLFYNLIYVPNDSIISRARNTLISEFYAIRDRFTHLLFLDADCYLPADGIIKMLSYDLDVISPIFPIKTTHTSTNNPNKLSQTSINIIPGEVASMTPGSKLIEVSGIGTAGLMISKKAVVSLVEDAIKDHRTYKLPGTNIVRFDVFGVGVIDGNYVGEDHWVCRKLRKLGYRIFVDPTIPTRHSGAFDWTHSGVGDYRIENRGDYKVVLHSDRQTPPERKK